MYRLLISLWDIINKKFKKKGLLDNVCREAFINDLYKDLITIPQIYENEKKIDNIFIKYLEKLDNKEYLKKN